MKNTMKISGIAGTILFGFAALFKIQHWPGAGIMMTLGAFILALVFLPSSLVVLWKESHNRRRVFLFISVFLTGFLFIAGTLFKIQHWPAAGIILVLSTLSAVLMLFPFLLVTIIKNEENKTKSIIYLVAAHGAVIYLIGMLFKIQHWPLATIFTVAGIVILGFIVLPWYSIYTWKADSHIDPKFIFIAVAFLAIMVPGALINLNLQRDYKEGYYNNQERQVSLNEFLIKNNSLLVSASDSSIMKKSGALHAATLDLLGKIDELRIIMINESEGKAAVNPVSSVQQPMGFDISYKNLTNPFQVDPVKNLLMSGSGSRISLEANIRNYTVNIKNLFPGNEDISGVLNPSLYLPVSAESRVSLLSALNSLDLLKTSILTVESRLLHSLNSANRQ